MTKPARFRPSDLTRAIKALVKAGVTVVRAEIDPDGRIILHSADATAAATHCAPADWRKRLENASQRWPA